MFVLLINNFLCFVLWMFIKLLVKIKLYWFLIKVVCVIWISFFCEMLISNLKFIKIVWGCLLWIIWMILGFFFRKINNWFVLDEIFVVVWGILVIWFNVFWMIVVKVFLVFGNVCLFNCWVKELINCFFVCVVFVVKLLIVIVWIIVLNCFLVKSCFNVVVNLIVVFIFLIDKFNCWVGCNVCLVVM